YRAQMTWWLMPLHPHVQPKAHIPCRSQEKATWVVLKPGHTQCHRILCQQPHAKSMLRGLLTLNAQRIIPRIISTKNLINKTLLVSCSGDGTPDNALRNKTRILRKRKLD